MKTINKNKILIFSFSLIFVFIFCVLVIKCKYGFGNLDESFYLTMPLRYCQGDGLFSNEWHLCLMSGYIEMPIMAIYMLINNSTEGIILAFRYIYIIIWSLSAIFIFIRLKNVSLIGSTIASMIYLIYVPYNIMALSYNTMGLMFLFLALVMYATNDNENKIDSFISGSFFSFSVLCCPTLVILFAIYVVYMLIKKELFNNKNKYFVFGIIFQFIIFVIFVLSRSTIDQLVKSFPLIFQDGEHVARTFTNIVLEYVSAFTQFNSFKLIGSYFLIIIIYLIDKKRKSIKVFMYYL